MEYFLSHTHINTCTHTCTNIHVHTPPPSNALLLNTRFTERKCIITALPFAPHKAAHIKRHLSLMFQQVISGITAKPCSCCFALSVEIVEIFVVSQHSHLNPAKKLVNSAFVFQLCVSHCISSAEDVAALQAGRRLRVRSGLTS